MSNHTSPTHFSGDVDHFYDPNFTAEISQKMRVPKRINVDGVSDMPYPGRPESHWMPAEKLEMFVPEKIVVTGGDDYHGTRSIPREISLDNTIMPPDPGIIRVQTPPKVITIDQTMGQDDYGYPPTPLAENQIARKFANRDQRNLSLMNSSMNESTAVEGMTLGDEVIHLRKQLAKLNRRVMSIELENMQRANKDKIIYAIGLAYFFFKTVLWLGRS